MRDRNFKERLFEDKNFVTEEIYIEDLSPMDNGKVLIWGQRTEIRENGSTRILRKKQTKLASCGHPVKDFQGVGKCRICLRYVCNRCLWICSNCGRGCCRSCGRIINRKVFCVHCLWFGILKEICRFSMRVLGMISRWLPKFLETLWYGYREDREKK